MKVVIATPIYPPEIGGPATYIKELCERIRDEHEITVVAYARNGEQFPGTTLIAVSKDTPLPVRLFSFTRSLIRAAKGADIIYAQNAVAAGLPAVLAGIIRRKPVVIKLVGDEAWERATQHRLTKERLEEFLAHSPRHVKIRLISILQGWVLRHASCVTTPSAYLCAAIVKAYGIRPNRAVVNYNAAEEHGSTLFEPEVTPHQILSTGRLTVWKGIDGVIDALALLKKDFPDASLVVAGDGPERRELEAHAKDLGVADAVRFLGNVSRAETWQLRKESEVYVLNSAYEGLPHTALTSFAAKIPTVATDISGTNEAVYHEESGLLVTLGDTRGLAQAIARIFNDKALAQHLVLGGTKILQEKFSWEAHLTGLRSIFSTVSDP